MKSTNTKTTNTNIGLDEKSRTESAAAVNRVLSDEHVLYVRTRNYHWNVTGVHFGPLHELFEKQYQILEAVIDEVAERVRSLGAYSFGSMAQFLKVSRLKEHIGDIPEANQMLANLLADHEAIIKHLREDVTDCQEKYHDEGTASFLTDVMEKHEKIAWMLRAHLS